MGNMVNSRRPLVFYFIFLFFRDKGVIACTRMYAKKRVLQVRGSNKINRVGPTDSSVVYLAGAGLPTV